MTVLPSPESLFSGLAPRGIVTVAVSGGGDSLALLLLAHAWAQTSGATLHAVTVDHGLRPEAAAEAAFVAGMSEGLDIDHTTLGWEGIKPFSGIADAARRARYQLIEEFAQAIGSDLILTGHTADDQAETVYMRLMREAPGDHGSATSLGRGLAGIARTSLLPGGTMLARPLIGVSRRQLRAYLRSLPQSWIEDPTNEDTTYERVRVRAIIAAGPQLRARLIGLAGVMARMRAQLSREAAALLSRATTVRPGPVFLFDAGWARQRPEPVYHFALQVLIALAGGEEHLVARSRIAALAARLAGPATAKMTLGGAVIEKAGKSARIYREMRNMRSAQVEPGEKYVWDGRLEIVNRGRETVHVGPLSVVGLDRLEKQRARPIVARPRAALHSTAMVRAGRQVFLPQVESDDGRGPVAARITARAIEHYCADSDFPILEWIRALDIERKAFLLPRP
ncbi:MAG: tRNA(Ile)-lysidine synthase [Alphaproteobacteria bacterium]|nr:MAG: tRNA(Ile)-lysidine synthase [Alphaproteobacteria bacterium]